MSRTAAAMMSAAAVCAGDASVCPDTAIILDAILLASIFLGLISILALLGLLIIGLLIPGLRMPKDVPSAH